MDKKQTSTLTSTKMLHYGRHDVTEADVLRVAETLQSELITTGPVTREFERAFASYLGAKHAVAVCNGTAALHLAMKVAEIGPGQRVVTTPNTFLASANCGAFVGATPDFVDIDPVSYNLCPHQLAANWLDDTRAVIPIHYAGGPADMPSIYELANSKGAIVVEDACHAVGGQIEHGGNQYKIGGHPWADMTVFSFHPVKTMTTGEGGMLVTDHDEYAEKARCLRSHGMIRDQDRFQGLAIDDYDEQGRWYYEMHDLGFNYRITDFQCALGLSQLGRLDELVSRRREIVATYNEAFANLPNTITPGLTNEADREFTSWHLYTLQIDFRAIGTTRTQVMTQLRAQNVGTQVLYIPVHLQPYYRNTHGYGPGKCPVAEAFYQRALSLPLYPALTDDDVSHVIESVRQVFGQKQNWNA